MSANTVVDAERPRGQKALIPTLALGPDPSKLDSRVREGVAPVGRHPSLAASSLELSSVAIAHADPKRSGQDSAQVERPRNRAERRANRKRPIRSRPRASHPGGSGAASPASTPPENLLAAALRTPAVPKVPDGPGPLAEPLDIVALWAAGAAEPDYLVPGLIARSTVSILSGDTGAGKTWVALALTHAIASGSDWLGHPVPRGKTVYIDEENPCAVPLARLRALGLTDEDAQAIRFYSRTGAAVGDAGATDARLTAILDDAPADLVVIDTATAATAVDDLNDNSQVAALYSRLRAIAERFGCAVVVLHHDRKMQPGESRVPAGQSMMGARQWAGQSDTHLAVKLTRRVLVDLADDQAEHRTDLVLSFPKLRDGVPPDPVPLRIVSLKDGPHLVSATVEVVPESEREPTAQDRLSGAIIAALAAADGPMRKIDIAAACDAAAGSSSFKRGLQALLDDETITRPEHGVYALSEPRPKEPAL